MRTNVKVESLEVKSYLVQVSIAKICHSFTLNLWDKESKIYEIVPTKEASRIINARDFAHICCALFSYSGLKIDSIYYRYPDENGKPSYHNIIHKTEENTPESYYESVLRYTNVTLINQEKYPKSKEE